MAVSKTGSAEPTRRGAPCRAGSRGAPARLPMQIWNNDLTISLLHSADMRPYNWSYTQFSQFNQDDSLLLASGVFLGPHNSSSGEIAVISLGESGPRVGGPRTGAVPPRPLLHLHLCPDTPAPNAQLRPPPGQPPHPSSPQPRPPPPRLAPSCCSPQTPSPCCPACATSPTTCSVAGSRTPA